jgi:hypothetical protein
MLNVVTLLLLFALQGGAAPADIIGRWRGTSVCTKIPENAACHDEVVVYDFKASSEKPGVVTLEAKKIVNGVPEPMGDLDVTYDEAHQRWSAEFSNSRVRIRWDYRIEGDSMTGTCVLLPSEKVARNVAVRRER